MTQLSDNLPPVPVRDGCDVLEPSRRLDVSDSADVVVAGAGIAGVAAALAAARAGASVLLLEDSFSPGGLATVGMVPEYLPIDDGCGRKVIGGIAEELLHLSTANLPRELPEACFRRAPAVWLDKNATEEQRRGVRFKTAYNPATYVLDLEALLVREGVRILYGTKVCAVIREGDALTHLVVENKSGRSAIAGRAFVDATGDADVCFLAGEPTVSNANNVPCGWFYTVRGDGSGLRIHHASHRFAENPDDRDSAEGPFFRGDDACEVTAQILASRDLIRGELAADRAALPDDRRQPIHIATIPCFRMTRRFAGAVALRRADAHRPFPDAVCLAPDWRRPGPVWAIPWRCLAATRTANLTVCGRCASWDESAWDAMRVIPVCAATGEACGLASAMSTREGVSSARIEPTGIAAAMRKRGNIIDEKLLAKEPAL